MYTYVQRPGCKKVNTAMYIHTGGVSNAYSRIRTARARVHGWVRTEKQRRRCVHGEATECSCSSGGNETRGSQPAGSEQNAWSCSPGGLGRNRRWKQGLAYRTTEETDLLHSEWGPVDWEGCGVPQNGGNRPPMVETGVLLIGRGVAYRKTDETDLCWSATVETGVLFIGRGVAYRKKGLHEILFISTVDLLQPPRATVDLLQPPRAPVHPASTARYSTGYCSTTPPRAPLHCLLFIQPSTPRGPV